MVNLQFYTIYVHVSANIKITRTMQELNNVIQLADNIHQHVTLATKGIMLPFRKYVSFFSGHYIYWRSLFRTIINNA